jgi:hypothetical protein
MDALAELVDRDTAIAAANWGELQVEQLASACAAKETEGSPA